VKAWTPALSTASLAELMAEFDRRDDAFTDIQLEWRRSTSAVSSRVRVERHDDARRTAHDRRRSRGAADRRAWCCMASPWPSSAAIGSALRQYWDELAVFDQLGLVQSDGA
jgi:hypothetical protein